MKKYLIIFFILFSTISFAESPQIHLEKAPIHRDDMASVKRGAKIFATTCMVCHSMVYMRYNKLAHDEGVIYEKMPLQVKWPEGARPPDLSLEADARGVDWIYTYLHAFYTDTSRPTGVNNLVFPNTMMPGIMVPYQGQQILLKNPDTGQLYSRDIEWYDLLVLHDQGSLTPQEFDGMITDVVNFLAYAAEPFHADQMSLGPWVIGFLIIFFILIYLLKREYWKDVE